MKHIVRCGRDYGQTLKVSYSDGLGDHNHEISVTNAVAEAFVIARIADLEKRLKTLGVEMSE